ncbi:MAG: peroxiredoxin family protein [Gemmatimonadaceae bacterium]
MNSPTDFTLPGLDGLDYSLHEALGKGPVLLAFWQTECGACKLAAPYFNRLYDAYENLTWSFWAICQEDAPEARAFVRKYNFRPTVLIDAPALTVSQAYDPPSTPTLYLIEPDAGITIESSGFAKDDLNAISGRIAEYAGAAYIEVAPADDGSPAFKPG